MQDFYFYLQKYLQDPLILVGFLFKKKRCTNYEINKCNKYLPNNIIRNAHYLQQKYRVLYKLYKWDKVDGLILLYQVLKLGHYGAAQSEEFLAPSMGPFCV